MTVPGPYGRHTLQPVRGHSPASRVYCRRHDQGSFGYLGQVEISRRRNTCQQKKCKRKSETSDGTNGVGHPSGEGRKGRIVKTMNCGLKVSAICPLGVCSRCQGHDVVVRISLGARGRFVQQSGVGTRSPSTKPGRRQILFDQYQGLFTDAVELCSGCRLGERAAAVAGGGPVDR